MISTKRNHHSLSQIIAISVLIVGGLACLDVACIRITHGKPAHEAGALVIVSMATIYCFSAN